MIERISRTWRVVATGFSFICFSTGALIVAMLLTIVLYPLPLDPHRKCLRARSIVRSCARFYVRSLKLLGLLTFDLRECDALDVRGKVVVANHPSLLDAVFLMSCFPNATSIVKESMVTSPFTSRLMALIDFIPNNLDGEGIVSKALDSLEDGQTLVIFPEGTRTADFGNLKMHRGAANIALAARCQIQPIFIDCQPLTLRKGEPWYHIPSKKPHFSFRALAPIDASEFIDENRSNLLQARALTRDLNELFSNEIKAPRGKI